jgi:PAS domain S-box-containing protein
MLTAIAFTAAVGIYSWRHRSIPGAKGLAFMMFFWSLKLTASTLGLISGELPSKVFWFQIERFCLLPRAVAALAFAMEYAGLDRWLNRRTLTLLAVPALLLIPLTLTNKAHYLIWTDMWLDGRIRFNPGVLAYPLWGYGLLLGTATIGIFIWLFIRSPLHRWPVGLILFSLFTSRTLFYLTEGRLNPVKPIDLFDLAAIIVCPVYFIALFHFRLFDVVPVARNRVIDQMRDGMLVIDAQTRIADLNRAAQELLGMESKVIGREAAQALQAHPKLLELIRNPAPVQDEIWLGDAHCYGIHISPLATHHGFGLGKLILFYDLSEEKEAQKQVQEHQKKLAMLKERELLARDLHDGVGQLLAAAHLQVKSVGDLLAKGDVALAGVHLDRTGGVIQQAKESIREYLLRVKARSSPEQGLFTALRLYLNQYDRIHGMHTDLIIPPDLEEKRMDPTAEVQLQWIIQEALTNVRRHSGASLARVIFTLVDSELRVTVEDAGRGFDPEEIGENQGFGLRAMRGRADIVGARLEVESAPSKGTRVTIRVPWRKGKI